MFWTRIGFAVLLVFLLAACGSGGSNQPTVNPPPAQNDFSLSVAGTLSINQGASGTLPVSIQMQGNPGSIALSLSGSALLSSSASTNNIAYSFTPTGTNSTLTFAVGSNVPTGNYALTVTGQAGTLSKTAAFTLTVTTASSNFGISMAANVSLVQGGIVTLPVTVSGNGFQGGTLGLSSTAALSISGTARLYYANDASEVGYSFDSISSQGANLTLFVGSAIPVGSYPLTVMASAAGVTQTAAITLNVLAQGKVYEIWPTASYGSYQSYLSQLQPGDVLVLHQGTYSGDALLTLSGTPEEPITIRGYGNGETQPVLEYTGSTSNEWEIHGSNLIVQGLEFEATQSDAVRIRPPLPPATGPTENITLVDDTFLDCGSNCITANDPNAIYQDIRLIDNLVIGALYTPVYIGNQDGNDTFHNFLFEGNVIDGRSIVATDIVGYGIEVKLNVEDAVLRNNYIVGARGPGIMTYGLENDTDPAAGDIIENNIVIGSCTDQNILVGAGPTIARNNLAMGGSNGGYGLDNYDNWNRSFGIQVYQNTSVLNTLNGFWIISTPGSAMADLQMYNNLAYPGSGGIGFQGLPAANGTNNIHDNDTAVPTAAMATQVKQLQGLIPSPQALKPFWLLLADGPLNASTLEQLLNAVTALPNQSSNSAARTCP